ncbi:hypothetical protein BRADI_2g45175v3 [Brachypodium distachyon]|uniref:Uncharacterized protein n=1 Tax=Brachypodium distachyon TaxID=15368 RepID=A0A2K2DE41_BRADI|nr:hypothetical protein BRADI_2g45175v3 [Brachypodium distachyon]
MTGSGWGGLICLVRRPGGDASSRRPAAASFALAGVLMCTGLCLPPRHRAVGVLRRFRRRQVSVVQVGIGGNLWSTSRTTTVVTSLTSLPSFEALSRYFCTTSALRSQVQTQSLRIGRTPVASSWEPYICGRWDLCQMTAFGPVLVGGSGSPRRCQVCQV